jgi:hypothetical protein
MIPRIADAVGIKRVFEIISRYPLISIALLSSLTASPIIFSPLTADDIPNATLRTILLSSPGNPLENWFSSIGSATSQWLNVEGRFFPGAVIYGHIVHYIFQGHGLYKLFLATICFAISTQIFYFLNFHFSKKASFVGTFFFLSTYSIRYVYFHDGVTSFAGMVPFALFCYLSALNLAIRSNRLFSIRFFSSIFLYVFASLIYEHFAILLFGTFVFLYYQRVIPKSVKFLFFGLSSLQILFALYFKLGEDSAPAYSLSFSPIAIFKTTFIQFLGGFPGSQYWSTNHFISQTLLLKIENAFLLIILLAVVSWIAFQKIVFGSELSAVKKNHILAYLFFGANLAFLPALLTGMTFQWQSAIPMGEAYLCVTIQSAGLSILAAILFDRLSKNWAPLANLVFLVFIALFYLNVTWNYLFIQQ